VSRACNGAQFNAILIRLYYDGNDNITVRNQKLACVVACSCHSPFTTNILLHNSGTPTEEHF
jgi:hypothetical protein